MTPSRSGNGNIANDSSIDNTKSPSLLRRLLSNKSNLLIVHCRALEIISKRGNALALGPSLERHRAADIDDHCWVLVTCCGTNPPCRQLRRIDRVFATVLAFILVNVRLYSCTETKST